MLSLIASIIVGGLGLLIAYLLSRPPELRPLRLSQLMLVPAAAVVAFNLLPLHTGPATFGDLHNFISYLAIMGFVALLLAPNIAYYFGIVFSNLVDPHDWTPFEEEIALRPIQKMIDRDQYQEALAELDQLLNKHKSTYEALMLKSKLLHHFCSVDETTATLLKMIPLSHTTEQQLAVMQLLAVLKGQDEIQATPFIPKTRRIRTSHELLLFPVDANDLSSHRTLPSGDYEVEETFRGTHLWLKLAGENWGNAEMCWEAVRGICPAISTQSQRNFFLGPVARMHQAVTNAIAGRTRFQSQAQARQLLKQANQFIRQEDWMQALPLLQNASASDPHSYEIAYRLMQAVRHTESKEGSARILRKVLNQSHWSEDEQSMLQHG